MKNYFKTLAAYNYWANDRLYEACSQLSSDEYLKDRKAFFKSIHGTLNHLLVADRLWLGRFKKVNSGITALDQILYPDFDSLKNARRSEDNNIIEFVESCSLEIESPILSYQTLSGKEQSFSLQWLLSHLFNHQTHHRGQVHNMLSQAGVSPPPLDLYYFLQI